MDRIPGDDWGAMSPPSHQTWNSESNWSSTLPSNTTTAPASSNLSWTTITHPARASPTPAFPRTAPYAITPTNGPYSTWSPIQQPTSPPPAFPWNSPEPPLLSPSNPPTTLSASAWNLNPPPARSAPLPPPSTMGPVKCQSMTDILSLSSRSGGHSLPRKLVPPPSTPRHGRRYGLLPPPPPDIPSRPNILTLSPAKPATATLPRTNPYFSQSPKSPLSPGYSKLGDFSKSSISLACSSQEELSSSAGALGLNRSRTHQSLAAINIAHTNPTPNIKPSSSVSFDINKQCSSLNPFVLTNKPKIETVHELNPFRVPLSHIPALDPQDDTKAIGEDFFAQLIAASRVVVTTTTTTTSVAITPCVVTTNPNLLDPLTQPQPAPTNTLPPIRKSSQVSTAVISFRFYYPHSQYGFGSDPHSPFFSPLHLHLNFFPSSPHHGYQQSIFHYNIHP